MMLSNREWVRHSRVVLTLAAAAALTMTACSSADDESASSSTPPDGTEVAEPIAVTYDGGIALLDGTSLDVVSKVPMDGFTRVNPAGDDDHLIVSDEKGFTVMDASHAELTDLVYPGEKPGHVVLHGGKTVLFTDSTGSALSFDPHELSDGAPTTREYTSASPHHGVAVELTDGTIVASVGDEENRRGARAVDAQGRQIAHSDQCPGVHGEAVASGEVVGLGCKDGVLLFKNAAFVKVPSVDPEYGATSTQVGSDASPVLVGDYKTDPDAEREFPTQFALIDTAAQKQRLVQMPGGASYSFRSLGRGPGGEALILGTDGHLHVFDVVSGANVKSIPVVGKWQEPMDWQEPRPSLFVRDDTAYVTDPATKTIKRVSLSTGTVSAEASLDVTPNEISGTLHKH
ncbi:zinc metallochaperone AztD [Gordonia sp. LUNF6]|uniref:zinc metallochaperone AztD n=1 Tax=Gordonia sp. LUNF6 TaxID=3388658 RepID=UPI003999C3D1